MSAFRRAPRIRIEPPDLDHPTLAAVRAYWERKSGARTMPSRADLAPEELKEHLPWIVLVDVAADLEEFRYRLIGTHVAMYFMEDSTGQNPAETFGRRDPEIAEGVLRIFRKVASERVCIHICGDADWIGSEALEFEALTLPLSNDDETVNMLLVVFAFDLQRLRTGRQRRAGPGVN